MALDYEETARIARCIADAVDDVRGGYSRLSRAVGIDRTTLASWASGEASKVCPPYAVTKVAAGLTKIGRHDLAETLIADANRTRELGFVLTRYLNPSEAARDPRDGMMEVMTCAGEAAQTLRDGLDPNGPGGTSLTATELKAVIEKLEGLKRAAEIAEQEAEHAAGRSVPRLRRVAGR